MRGSRKILPEGDDEGESIDPIGPTTQSGSLSAHKRNAIYPPMIFASVSVCGGGDCVFCVYFARYFGIQLVAAILTHI